jgi:hypothetical protein
MATKTKTQNTSNTLKHNSTKTLTFPVFSRKKYCTSTSHTIPAAPLLLFPEEAVGGLLELELLAFSWMVARPPAMAAERLPERPREALLLPLLEAEAAMLAGLRRENMSTTGSPGTVTLNIPSGSSVWLFCLWDALHADQSYAASRCTVTGKSTELMPLASGDSARLLVEGGTTVLMRETAS